LKLTPEQFATLQGFVDAGNATDYYNTLAQAGHDYGNLALQAATDTGFWGTFANNFLEEKAEQFQVPFDRDTVMRDLMERDLAERQQNEGEPLATEIIRDYHHEVFEQNGLPASAWTGSFWDDRAGSAAWCMGCNGQELGGQSWEDALSNYFSNLSRERRARTRSYSRLACCLPTCRSCAAVTT
jgi:hypothetical protein